MTNAQLLHYRRVDNLKLVVEEIYRLQNLLGIGNTIAGVARPAIEDVAYDLVRDRREAKRVVDSLTSITPELEEELRDSGRDILGLLEWIEEEEVS